MEKLIEIRQANKWNQTKMAKYIGCSERQFRRYEKRECDVPLKVAIRWAKKLGISLNKFSVLYYK